MLEKIKQFVDELNNISDLKEKINAINEARFLIHQHSPFKNEPIDFVKWEVCDNVTHNDYNPNKVAPPEMELLEVSILNDGYTQPIVSWQNDDKNMVEVIDGFHRSRVGKESKIVKQRVMGYLPIVNIRTEQSGKNDRIASTIRHNRARGKHQVDAMSEIVIELKNRNWTNARISKQLGMDEEEVLRLCQISGIENIFSDQDFSRAWEASENNQEYEVLSDDVSEDVMDLYKIPNEKDTSRIFHTYEKWECHKAGFYETKHKTLNDDQCKEEYFKVLKNPLLFSEILEKLIVDWKYSCEHYLTNKSMNRIAWLGQAAVCYNSGVPNRYAGAWFELTKEEQDIANDVALKYLNKWLEINGLTEASFNEAAIIGRQVELY